MPAVRKLQKTSADLLAVRFLKKNNTSNTAGYQANTFFQSVPAGNLNIGTFYPGLIIMTICLYDIAYRIAGVFLRIF